MTRKGDGPSELLKWWLTGKGSMTTERGVDSTMVSVKGSVVVSVWKLTELSVWVSIVVSILEST